MSDHPKNSPYNAAYTIYCQTALHAGSGAVLSHVDLPIQREVHSGHPIVNASGWKGALCEHCDKADFVESLFGSEPGRPGPSTAGCGIFQELRLLLFPVRSFKEVFVWATCPLILERAKLHLNGTGIKIPDWPLPQIGNNTAWFDDALAIKENLCIEDYDFLLPSTATPESKALFAEFRKQLAELFIPEAVYSAYWHNAVKSRTVVLSDDDFANIAALHTQIETHVQINDDGTVGSGPWNQESLPPDSVLYTAIRIPAVLEGSNTTPAALGVALESMLDQKLLPVGGDRSLGKGWVKAAKLRQPAAANEVSK